MKALKRVLVIKAGDLGALVLAFPAFERIRQAHPKAQITLLTTPGLAGLARSSPYFDVVDARGLPSNPFDWISLVARIRRARFDRIYDLQSDAGSNLIFQGLRPFAPAWSGAALGCSLPHRNPARARMHPLERQAEQLQAAGIWPDAPTAPLSAPPPDISWILRGPAGARPRASQRPMSILAPGPVGLPASRRWPIESYGELAVALQRREFDIVIVGGFGDSALAHVVQRRAARARDLTGRPDLAQIASLGARSAIAIGNDMGSLHLTAAAGAPTIALFASDEDSGRLAPRGHVTVLHAPTLKELSVAAVLQAALALSGAPA